MKLGEGERPSAGTSLPLTKTKARVRVKKLGRRVEGDRSTLRPYQDAGSISEGELHTELDLAWRLGCVERTKRRVANIGVEADKVRVVQEVEKLSTELEAVTLLQAPVLCD